MRYYYDYSFPIGNLTIEEDGHGICGIYFGTKTLEGEKKNTELIREAALQLSQYFDGRRKKFDLKLSYHGTEFQIKVVEKHWRRFHMGKLVLTKTLRNQ